VVEHAAASAVYWQTFNKEKQAMNTLPASMIKNAELNQAIDKNLVDMTQEELEHVASIDGRNAFRIWERGGSRFDESEAANFAEHDKRDAACRIVNG
jgi:hypothetical protein